MGKYFDFRVRWNPAEEGKDVLAKRILYTLFIKRIKYKKPTVIFISAESGEGKSMTALKLQEILLQQQGMSLLDYIDDVNVYTPLEYPTKLDNMLFDKEGTGRLKNVNIICMHEAREIIKAKNWHSFLNQAVSDVNAMSRTVKRLCFMIVSQFIRDISTDIRYTLNYYITIYRPLGKKARMSIYLLWKDDSDLEKPKLRKRLVRGYIVYPDGKQRIFKPKYLEVTMPSDEVIKIFEKRDYEAKANIIRNKIEKLILEMQQELKLENKKVDAMVEYYAKHQEHLPMIGITSRGKWKVRPEIKTMHDLTDVEVKTFQEKLNIKLKDVGLIANETA